MGHEPIDNERVVPVDTEDAARSSPIAQRRVSPATENRAELLDRLRRAAPGSKPDDDNAISAALEHLRDEERY